jgi:hypothetical protein
LSIQGRTLVSSFSSSSECAIILVEDSGKNFGYLFHHPSHHLKKEGRKCCTHFVICGGGFWFLVFGDSGLRCWMDCWVLTGKLQVSSSIAHSSFLVLSFSSLHVPGEPAKAHTNSYAAGRPTDGPMMIS